MAGNLQAAIDQAMQICWDESIGYNMGGMAHSAADGVDCSGLVGRCLSDAGGYNYPSTHVGTQYMKPALLSAGFTIIPITAHGQIEHEIMPGDIVVMNHPLGQGGHTFFYMEDIRAYTDYSADSANIGIVHKAKVEAASSRGHSGQGDSRKNGNGAYWEVWCHAYYELCPGYDPTDPDDEIYIARDPNGLDDGSGILLGSLLLWNKRRKLL